MQTLAFPLISFLYLSPLLFLFDGPAVLGLLLLGLSFSLFLTNQMIPPGEAQFFEKITWPLVGLIALPAILMIVQVLPLPFLAHPVWQSAASALGEPFGGSVSVDTGATLLALCRYCAFCAAMLLSAAAGVNRARAQTILMAALTAATAVAALHILSGLGGPFRDAFALFSTSLHGLFEAAGRNDVLVIACFGLILALAFINQLYEKREVQRFEGETGSGRLLVKGAFGLAALLICASALLRTWSGPLAFAIGAALVAFGYVLIVRRFELGLWARGALATTALIMAAALVAQVAGQSDLDITLRFAPDAAAKFETVQRMLPDVPMLGTGAGTFGSLLQLYRSLEDSRSLDLGATFAATVDIEMGRIFLWASVILIAIAIAFFLRAALRRGRDWIYPAATASCLMMALTLAFAEPALGGSVPLLLGATILGLGLAQSRSRTVR